MTTKEKSNCRVTKVVHKAFVLINCESGKEPSILEQLKKLENVVEAQGTYGIYELVVRIESDSQSQLENIISDQIRNLSDINSTSTLIPTEEQNDLPELIPDIIPEGKKPLEEPPSSEEDLDDDEDYDDSAKLN